MELNERDDGLDVRITEDLCIYEMAQLHGQLTASLERAETIRLDLGAIGECDSAGLQWLLTLRAWARASNRTLVIDPVSDALRELVELFQVQSQLGLHTLITAGEG